MHCQVFDLRFGEDLWPPNLSVFRLGQIDNYITTGEVVFDVLYSVSILKDGQCLSEQHSMHGMSGFRH